MVTVKGVLHIPNLDRRLLSVPKIAQHGLHMRFGANQCDIFIGNDLGCQRSAKGTCTHTMWNVSEPWWLITIMLRARELWHARIGHPSHIIYDKTQQSTKGLSRISDKDGNLCSGGLQGKMTVARFPK